MSKPDESRGSPSRTTLGATPASSSHAFGFAGGRVATTLINSGGGIDTWTVTTATTTTPRPTRFQTSSSTWPSPCCSTPLEHLAGDSSFCRRRVDHHRISQSQPCAAAQVRRTLVEDRRHVVELHPTVVRLTVAPSGRPASRSRSTARGEAQLFGADGTPLRTITYAPAKLLGAAIEGDDIVVLTSPGLADYDAASGDLRRQRQLPTTDARLNDLAGGVVAYTVGRRSTSRDCAMIGRPRSVPRRRTGARGTRTRGPLLRVRGHRCEVPGPALVRPVRPTSPALTSPRAADDRSSVVRRPRAVLRRRRRRRERPITEDEAYRHSYGYRSETSTSRRWSPSGSPGEAPAAPVLERGERIRLAFAERMSARRRGEE